MRWRGFKPIETLSRKKKEYGIKREAKQGIKRSKQIRKAKADELLFGAKADAAEQKLRYKLAKRGVRPKRKKGKRRNISRKLGMRFI